MLSGGEALGAYHAGVYAALHAAGVWPDWVAGGSIGSLVGAIIAGNAPEERIRQLRAFWSFAASPTGMGLAPRAGSLRRDLNVWNGLQSLLLGRPGLFRHRYPGLLSAMPGMPDDLSLFDPGPLRSNLPNFIDFQRLNGGEIRFSVVAVDLETGERVVFDNQTEAITADHLLASCAIPVKFPPVRIGDRLLGDAGLSTNLPVNVVFAESTGDTVCIAVDLFNAQGSAAASIDGALERLQDLVFANQTKASIRLLEREFELRRIGGTPCSARLLYLAYQGFEHESGVKALDYSRISIDQRWAAGERDMAAGLARLAALGPLGPGLEVLRGV